MRSRVGKPEAREVSFQGIPIVMEHEKGSMRTGTNAQGEPWSRKMECGYGYIPATASAGDQEEVDVYLGEDSDAPNAYVVEQLDEDGNFDEHKLCLGFNSLNQARQMYLAHYPEGWEDHVADIWEVPIAELKTAVADHGIEETRELERRAALDRGAQQ
jgi:hypothetical protein